MRPPSPLRRRLAHPSEAGLVPFYSPECVPRKESSSGGSLTVSLGVTEFSEETASLQLLIRAADEEPYRAKADGKNRVAAAGSR